ncbi:MAG TPA: PaaI family thioesterase [Ilumatobacter sp.]|jgi:acyl-coenzyme A thioesterase PaaI-like protein|nr:PaaI family thioesterase [Ilumatobacter sp.]
MPDWPPVDPRLAEARARAGRALRDIGHAFVGRHATLEQIEHLSDVLESISAELWPADPRSRTEHDLLPGLDFEVPQGPFRGTFDDRPISGRSSPWGLDLDMHRYGDEIEGRVVLRSAHEGAPGRAHGGIIAALFDDVFGYVLGVLAQPAFTGDLYVRYAAAAPLHRQLACRVRLHSRTGRKLVMTGELSDVAAGTHIAGGTATFVTVDAEEFASITAERPAPPDERR